MRLKEKRARYPYLAKVDDVVLIKYINLEETGD